MWRGHSKVLLRNDDDDVQLVRFSGVDRACFSVVITPDITPIELRCVDEDAARVVFSLLTGPNIVGIYQGA